MLINQVSIFKTIYYNLKLFRFSDAIRLPLVIGKKTTVDLKRNDLVIKAKIKPGLIAFGIGGSPDLYSFESHRNYIGVKNCGVIEFHGKAHFAIHTSCFAAGGKIVFGDGFSSNVGCKISSTKEIKFGADCLLGGNVVVRDSDGHKVYDLSADTDKQYHEMEKPVKIGNHVWIGNNASVLKGVEIGNECIVGYGAIVTKPMKTAHCLIGGVPGKVLKNNIAWER